MLRASLGRSYIAGVDRTYLDGLQKMADGLKDMATQKVKSLIGNACSSLLEAGFDELLTNAMGPGVGQVISGARGSARQREGTPTEAPPLTPSAPSVFLTPGAALTPGAQACKRLTRWPSSRRS